MLMRTLILFVAIALPALGSDPLARQAPPVAADPELLGSWTLESVEQRVGTAQSSRIANPRGLLVFDSAGHMLEVVTRASGGGRGAAPAPAPSTTPGLTNFASFSGSGAAPLFAAFASSATRQPALCAIAVSFAA